MKKLLCLLLLTLPISAQANITGPISTDTGDFTPHWEPASGRTLVEVSVSGQTISSWQTSPARIVKSIPGDYYFEERWCGLLFSGTVCCPIDKHTVTFSRGHGQQQPQFVEEGYRAYYADVDGNWLQDVYVERLTASSLDGSLQSYVLLNRGNGTLSTVAAGEAGFDYFAARALLPEPTVRPRLHRPQRGRRHRSCHPGPGSRREPSSVGAGGCDHRLRPRRAERQVAPAGRHHRHTEGDRHLGGCRILDG